MKTSKKKIAVVAACLVVVAIAVVVFATWYSWSANNDGGSAADELVSKYDDGSVSVGGSDGPGGVEQYGDVPDLGDYDFSESGDDYPGQSLGFVGPHGERSIEGRSFATNEEYQRALEKQGVYENEMDMEPAVKEYDAGKTLEYYYGIADIHFAIDCSEYDAHLVVQELGGIWVRDEFGVVSAEDKELFGYIDVTAYFPNYREYDDLRIVCGKLCEYDEVLAARPRDADNGMETGEDGAASTSLSSNQIYIGLSRFDKAWSIVKCSGSVTVAVIDVGFDLDHPDLTDNLLGCWDAAGTKLLQNDPYTGSDHGTRVCGVVSAVAGNGVGIDGCSYNAEIMPVRRCDDSGHGDILTAVSALTYLANLPEKPDVVNMSFGWYRLSSSDPSYGDRQNDLATLELAINRLANEGVVLVATAGNDSCSDLRYPASFDNVMSVSSVDSSKSQSSFSNANDKVDICAMGTDVYSTSNPAVSGKSYDSGNGTSFAAPQVAAAAALLRAQHSDWSATHVKSHLETTATDLGDSGRDDVYGNGLLDIAKAVGWNSSGGSSPGTAEEESSVSTLEQMHRQEVMASASPDEIEAALRETAGDNPDVFAWIEVPGTNVSLPVARRQGDDTYYLEHAADGSLASYGCAFVSAAASTDMNDSLTVVYGHTCRVDAMFSQLHLFGYEPLFNAMDEVRVYLLDGRVLYYEVVAASVLSDAGIEDPDGYDAGSNLQAYLNAVTNPDWECNLVRKGTHLNAAVDCVLQLSTCSSTGDASRRFAITCVLRDERQL